MKLIAEVKNCKANNDTKVSMISNAVINHHFGVVDFKGAQKDEFCNASGLIPLKTGLSLPPSCSTHSFLFKGTSPISSNFFIILSF